MNFRLMCQTVLLVGVIVSVPIYPRTVSFQDVIDVVKKEGEKELEKSADIDLTSLNLQDRIQKATGFPLIEPIQNVVDSLEDTLLKNVKIKRNVLSGQFDASYFISGSVDIDMFSQLRSKVQLDVTMAKKDGEWKPSVALHLPKNWQLRDMIPRLQNSPIGSAPLPDGRIIFSTFDYTDRDGFEVKKGVDIASHVELNKVSRELYQAIDTLRPKNSGLAQSVTFEGFESVRLNAHLAKDIASTSFDIVVPLRIGVDFQELKKQGTIKRMPSGIRKITTGNIKAQFIGAQQEAKIEQGVKIHTTTQESPLDLRASVDVNPNSMKIVGKMDGSWDPAITDWLAINDPAFELNFDFTLMSELAASAVPVPFTGLKVRGGMGIGPKDSRTTINLAAGVEISDDPRDLDFAMVGNVDTLSLEQLADLFDRIAKKKKIPRKKLPKMELRNVTLYVVPKDMTIADKAYESGFSLSGDMRIQQFQGGANFTIDSEERRITAQGYIKPFKIGDAFVLTGKGRDKKLGTKDDQANIEFTFPPKGDTSIFEIDGMMQIPLIRFESEAFVTLNNKQFTFDTRGDIAGFKGSVRGSVPYKKPATSKVAFEIQNRGINHLMERVVQKLQKVHAKIQKDLGTARDKIDQFKKQYEGDVKKEKKRITQDITKLKKTYNKVKDKCKAKSPLKRLVSKDCYKAAKLKTELLTKEKIYRDFMLKEGKKLGKAVSVPGKFVDQAKKLENKANKLTQAIKKASQIKNIRGDIDIAAMKKGKLPELQVELESGKKFKTSLDPKELVRNIAQRIMKI